MRIIVMYLIRRIFTIALMIAPLVSFAANPYAQAEVVGTVGSVFPEAGYIVVNGKKFAVSKKLQILSRFGGEAPAELREIKSGMAIQYALDKNESEPTISIIIVEGDN
jgi:hypothetical protein